MKVVKLEAEAVEAMTPGTKAVRRDDNGLKAVRWKAKKQKALHKDGSRLGAAEQWSQ